MQFARRGIREVLIMDNGSEFDNQEFTSFKWHFEHRTSSPINPQSNGEVENSVKACKGLPVKAKNDPLFKQFSIGATPPSEEFSTSPVQRLLGLRTRTLLQTAK